MKRLIYQVNVGQQSNLYDHCIASVARYCEDHGIDHYVQERPKLWIKPDPFTSNRSKAAVEKAGCLPIFEKENAFAYLDEYDQVAIVDADIYVRGGSPNVFEQMRDSDAFGGVVEAHMPITQQHKDKIRNYSHMQYASLVSKTPFIQDPVHGYHFHNMGMMVLNKRFKDYLDGDSPEQFIRRSEFKKFVDGIGPWKWSTDQTLLNYWIRKRQVPTNNLNWRWNALYNAVRNDKIKDAYFVHFFLKDKLPRGGEDVQQLMKMI